MDEMKVIYQIQTEIWHLFKKYGTDRLNDAVWDRLLDEGNQLHKNTGQSTRTWDNCSRICT